MALQRQTTAPRLDFAAVNRAALACLPALCRRWLPDGRREGSEWVVGSLGGEPGRSLKIRLAGQKAGVWHDFAEGIGGSDPISLAAALFGLSQREAARRVAEMLGVGR
jgi:putative DNA primase/helicase